MSLRKLFYQPKSSSVTVMKSTRPLNKSNNVAFKKMISRAMAKKTPKSKTFNPAKSHISHVKVRLANGAVKDMYKVVIVKRV